LLSHLHMCLQCILTTFSAFTILPCLPSPLLRKISTFHCAIFIYVYKVHQSYSLYFTFSVNPLPSHWYLSLDLFYFLVIFLYLYWLSNGVLPWYFTDTHTHTHTHTHTTHMFYFSQINPLYYLFFLYHRVPILFNSFQCISLCYHHAQMQYISILFTLYHSLFLSHLSLIPFNRPTIVIMLSFSFSLHMYIKSCMCLYIHWSFRSSFHI
jgi:hypothetical protein